MSEKYSIEQKTVENILGIIRNGEVAIPEIQRPFVWKGKQVRDLVDSLFRGSSAGYLIIWQNPDVKLKDGQTSVGKKILIDGQQRVTADFFKAISIPIPPRAVQDRIASTASSIRADARKLKADVTAALDAAIWKIEKSLVNN